MHFGNEDHFSYFSLMLTPNAWRRFNGAFLTCKNMISTLVLAIAIASCNSSGANTQSGEADLTNPDEVMSETTNREPTGDVLKLVKREVVDREGTGMVASTYLLPADWTVEDRLYWEYNDPTLPIRFKATFQSIDRAGAAGY
jgi:hypothetical protein